MEAKARSAIKPKPAPWAGAAFGPEGDGVDLINCKQEVCDLIPMPGKGGKGGF